METTKVDWSMGSQAARLVDWDTAADIGRRVGGRGPALHAIERARLREDLAEIVPHAQSLVSEFTALSVTGFRSRAWVMSRGEWVSTNLQGLQRLLEPLARRILTDNRHRSDLRRKALGFQVGGLLGNTIITETLFALPGVGRLMIDAIFSRDFFVVQGVILFLAVGYVLSNLAVDLLYSLLDPRIRLP